MLTIEWLFYTQKEEASIFTRFPPGRLSVPRLLSGDEKCWERDASAAIQYKKTLLICDWSIISWPEYRRQQLQAVLRQGLAEEFEIFVWQIDKPMRLTYDDLYLFYNHKFLMNIAPNGCSLRKAMEPYQVASDALAIIDYFKMRKLLREVGVWDISESMCEQLDDKCWQWNTYKEDGRQQNGAYMPSKIAAWINMGDTVPKSILARESGNWLQEQLPHIPRHIEYDTWHIDNANHMINLNETKIKMLRKLTVGNISFKKAEQWASENKPFLKHVEDIVFKEHDTVSAILAYTKKVKKIQVINIGQHIETINFMGIDLSHLEEIQNIRVNINDFHSILRLAKNLKVFFGFLHGENANLLIEPNFAGGSHLERVTLFIKDKGGVEYFNNILHNMRSLVVLSVITGFEYKTPYDHDASSVFAMRHEPLLPELRSFCFEARGYPIYSEINTIACVLNNAPNLCQITLKRFHMTDRVQVIAPVCEFQKLKKITIEAVEGFGIELEKLLKAPKIAKVKITRQEPFEWNSPSQHLQELVLKSLQWKDKNVTLFKVVMQSRKLKKITMENVDAFKKTSYSQPSVEKAYQNKGIFPLGLENFSLEESSFSESAVLDFLSCYNNLKVVHVIFSTNSEERLQSRHPSERRPTLSEISLQVSRCSADFFTHLITGCSRLSELNLRDTEVTHGCISTIPETFRNIEILSLESLGKNMAYYSKLFFEKLENIRDLNIATCDDMFFHYFNGSRIAQLKQLERIKMCFSKENFKKIKMIQEKCTKLTDIVVCYDNGLSNDLGDEDVCEIARSYGLSGVSAEYCDWLPEAEEYLEEYSEDYCDASTAQSNIVLHLEPYFISKTNQPLEPREERIKIIERIEVNPISCVDAHAFRLVSHYEDGKNMLRQYPERKNSREELRAQWGEMPEDAVTYYGMFQCRVSSEWVSLPSGSTEQNIIAYYVEPSIDDLEFACGLKDALWYCRAATSKRIEIEFLVTFNTLEVSVALESIERHDVALKNSIESLINECQSYGGNALTMNCVEPTGQDFFEAMRVQKQGSCRHRTVSFMIQMMEKHPTIAVRGALNRCHMYAELQWEEKWYRCDLGGHPSEINIIQPTRMGAIFENVAMEEASMLENDEKSEMEIDAMDQFEHAMHFEGDCVPPPPLRTFVEGGYEGKNVLLELSTVDMLEACAIAARKWARECGRSVYYIDTPDEIRCASKWVQRGKDNAMITHAGPGGPLHEFLLQTREETPLIVVNFGTFESDDCVRLNSLFEFDACHRKSDGTSVPLRATILGLSYDDPFRGDRLSDFYGRFHVVEKNFIFPQNEWIFLKVDDQSMEVENGLEVDLYESSDWKPRLLGRWQFGQEGIYYKAGKLEKYKDAALRAIVLKNPPWHLREFRQWTQSVLLDRLVQETGLHFAFKQGVNWENVRDIFSFSCAMSPAKTYFPLNPSTLPDYWGYYRHDPQSGALYAVDGWIKANRKQVLYVFLSRPIPPEKIFKLADKCRKYGVKCHVVGSLESIKQTFPYVSDDMLIEPLSVIKRSNSHVIETNDPDYVVHTLEKRRDICKVLDITNSEAELFFSILSMRSTEFPMTFERQYGALWQALANDEHVIIMGEFSDEWRDRLIALCVDKMTLWQGNEQIPSTGYVTIVGKNMEKFKSILGHDVEYIDVTLEQKCALLQVEGKVPENIFTCDQKHDLVHGRAKMVSADPWSGLYSIVPDLCKVNMKCEPGISERFEAARVVAVESMLSQRAHIFIVGLTGVAKTTFIENNLSNRDDCKTYMTCKMIHAWANDRGAYRKLLVIDEANLETVYFSIFEGLYPKRKDVVPHIIIEGQYYELDSGHKVIFIGNPLHYGAGRRRDPFLERHGNTVVFSPLPAMYLYEKILMPLWEGSDISQKAREAISKIFLRVYAHLCSISEDRIWITPRELEMMTMITLAKAINGKVKIGVVFDSAYTVAKNALPKEKQADFSKWFFSVFERDLKKQEKQTVDLGRRVHDFTVTFSRKEALCMLQDMLAVRRFQQCTKDPKQRRAGLGGVLLEGEPGDGKSHLARAVLIAAGLTEITLQELNNVQGDKFCEIPASGTVEEKKLFLLRAFHAGIVVIMNEINSCPLQEKYLNHLLMGKDDQGQVANVPGFKIIATANPAHFAGRRVLSDALLRRLMVCRLPSYCEEELCILMEHRWAHMDVRWRAGLVRAFVRERERAIEKKKGLLPSFRLLLKVAEELTPPAVALPPILASCKHVRDEKLGEEQEERSYKRARFNGGE